MDWYNIMGRGNDKQREYDIIEAEDDKGYLPTPAENRLLEVLLDPDCIGWLIKDKIAKAGISIQKYYDSKKNPKFIEFYYDLFMKELKAKVPNVVDAMYNFAIKEPRNTADRIAFLRLNDLLEDKKTININKKSMEVKMNFGNMATDDIATVVKDLLRKDPDLIREIIEKNPDLIEGIMKDE